MKHLVIMAKKPAAGRVKSRLAKSIGGVRANGVYRNILTFTMRTLANDTRWKTWAAIAPDNAIYEPIWPLAVTTFAQGNGNLGARMQRIFDIMPPGPVIIIGTDIPFIRKNDIADAFDQIGSNDLVFGAAGDGGFWLVGARRSPRIENIFENVRWSGKHALSDTLANSKHLKTGYAGERYDIDNQSDYLNWRKSQI